MYKVALALQVAEIVSLGVHLPHSTPLVVACANARSSAELAEVFRDIRGYLAIGTTSRAQVKREDKKR